MGSASRKSPSRSVRSGSASKRRKCDIESRGLNELRRRVGSVMKEVSRRLFAQAPPLDYNGEGKESLL